MIQTSLMDTDSPMERVLEVKDKLAANFLVQYEVAKNAFKALSDNALLKAWELTVAWVLYRK